MVGTGAAGFIGNHIRDRLPAAGHTVMADGNFRTDQRLNLAAAPASSPGVQAAS